MHDLRCTAQPIDLQIIAICSCPWKRSLEFPSRVFACPMKSSVVSVASESNFASDLHSNLIPIALRPVLTLSKM